jgi:hypothetical protein
MRIQNQDIRQNMKVEITKEKLVTLEIQWYGHVLHMDENNCFDSIKNKDVP